MQFSLKGSGEPNYPLICPNFGLKAHYYLQGGRHFNQIGSNSIGNRNPFIYMYKEMSATCEICVNFRLENCPIDFYRESGTSGRLWMHISVLSRTYLHSNVRMWAVIPHTKICLFYGHFVTGSVPDPSTYCRVVQGMPGQAVSLIMTLKCHRVLQGLPGGLGCPMRTRCSISHYVTGWYRGCQAMLCLSLCLLHVTGWYRGCQAMLCLSLCLLHVTGWYRGCQAMLCLSLLTFTCYRMVQRVPGHAL